MDEGVGGSGAPSHRQGPDAGAMALAGRHAAMPADGQRAVGNPDGPADETDGARAGQLLPRAPGRAARIYQEDAGDAGCGPGVGAEAQEGAGAMSKKHMGSSID